VSGDCHNGELLFVSYPDYGLRLSFGLKHTIEALVMGLVEVSHAKDDGELVSDSDHSRGSQNQSNRGCTTPENSERVQYSE
jgi:hypothetical protein